MNTVIEEQTQDTQEVIGYPRYLRDSVLNDAIAKIDTVGEFKKWGKIPQNRSFFSSRRRILTTIHA